jgi:23S rRNA (guanosine2251-2'-O)-methyltransferase
MSRAELIYGIHAVRAALRARPGDVLELWVDPARGDARTRELVDEAADHGVSVQAVDPLTLKRRLGSARHQGVVARVRPRGAPTEGQLPGLLEGLPGAALILVLDGITDPHNLGACLRSAEAAGADLVIVPRDRAAGITSTVRKVASGAAERIPVLSVKNLARALRTLKDHGIWVQGTDDRAPISLYELDLTLATALVLGAEGRGLRRLTRELCDQLVCLPMAGQAESLNVSVAAGVCLFEARRQRLHRGPRG